MRHVPSYILDIAFVLPLILGVECVIEKRKCYQCEVTDLSLCTDEYLLPCPETQAFDSCMTRIFKTKNDKDIWIHKGCALGPCSLRDETQSTGLGLDHCDRSKEEFDCFSCCREDGCNTGGAATHLPELKLILYLTFFLSFFKIKCFV